MVNNIKKHCSSCGVLISETARTCPKCGAEQLGMETGKVIKYWLALVFSIFLGWLGIDRFYAGHTGYGIIKLLTFGGFLVWWFIDIILFATKSVSGVTFKD